ncbi:MAG TPA: BON domain-containing protein [Gemmatimonadaceae bacterium]|nr:BON domain-containing protein [Gemmatimonadaceae bacterium]
MADDFDNTDEIQNLTDDELRQLVLDQLREQPMLDGDQIGVHTHEGKVTVSGTVGTEEERRILDHVLTDSIGLTNVKNNVVIGELYRAASPEPMDEYLVDEEEHSGLLLGDTPLPFSPEAEHLADIHEPGGTHDPMKATEDGEPWIPPEGPTPEGVSGLDEGHFGHDPER